MSSRTEGTNDVTTKSTAALVRMATADNTAEQQMVVFTNGAVFRRSLSPGTRTQWRYAAPSDLPTWAEGYCNLASAGPEPMNITHGPVLMEVTEDEQNEANAEGFNRNVGLRFARIVEALDADPATQIPVGGVKDFLDEWHAAQTSDDNAWLDRHTHVAGTARPAPAPAAAPAPEPEVEVPSADELHGWVYPETVGGFITLPNGHRYKVRTLEGSPDVQVIRESRAVREHGFLFGEPGTGKTVLLDAAYGDNMVTMLGTEDTEVADFTGGYVMRAGVPLWVDGALVEAMERGCPLFVDEIGVIAPKVLTTVFSVMDGRDKIRIVANPDRGIVEAQPGFVVYAATNPHAPGVRLSEALLSRFALHLEVTTDYAMMRELGVDDALVTAAENMETRRRDGLMGWAPQARELLRTQDQWKRRGVDFAIRNLIASAPEDDREEVADKLGAAMGHTPKTGLRL
jgi:hypothetical protein